MLRTSIAHGLDGARLSALRLHQPHMTTVRFLSAGRVSKAPFNVLYLGASAINFGTTEAGWNHSARLEKKLPKRLRVFGIVDENADRAAQIIAQKKSDNPNAPWYADTEVFSSVQDAHDKLKERTPPKLQLVVNGLPASVRGSAVPGKDIDLQAVKAFPRAAHFLEKPISEEPNLREVKKVATQLGNRLVSVGYMSRYLKGVQEIKQIIQENNLKITSIQGVYLMAYKWAGERPAGYWSLDREAGPMVTQGTHFVDLMRYFSPDPELSSLSVQTVEAGDPNGTLGALTHEYAQSVAPEHTIPRYTNASWRSKDGVINNLLHGVALHDGDFDSSLTVLADGWKFRLVDTYSPTPRLFIRRPGDLAEKETKYRKDDPYYTEFSTLVDVVDGKMDRSAILSPIKDAFETYKLTWAIRKAGEAAARKRGVKST